MKILPGLAVSKMSGTIAGTTYQNWRGILVARSKPTPTNVNSPRQSVVRALMTILSRAWRDELNQGLRTAWNQRAKNYPWLDVFGNTFPMTGENLYIKQNMVLLDHFLPRQDTPVPDQVPSAITSMNIIGTEDLLTVQYDQLAPAEVSAQLPFIDISIAGAFLEANVTFSVDKNVTYIRTNGLTPGRVHQKSDFRHAVYADDTPVSEPVAKNEISVERAILSDRNIVLSLRRFNKYGNFSAPVLLQNIVTEPAG